MLSPKLIVLTLEGLATAGLGCYGCSWNETPTLDALAADGCLWDRWIAPASRSDALTGLWWQADSPWAPAWRHHGTLELFTDTTRMDESKAAVFDQVSVIQQAADTGRAAEDIESTRLGRLVAAAIERCHQGNDWSTLWLHSDFLSHHWDAPRELIAVDFDGQDEMQEPVEDTGVDEVMGPAESRLPDYFDEVIPPSVQCRPSDDPDLVMSWMRTYACQLRLVDELVGVLQKTLAIFSPTMLVTSSGGFSLGQNGWIARDAGPLRSCHVRLPLIVNRGGPLRHPGVTSSAELPLILERLAEPDRPVVSVEQWCQSETEFDPCVTTRQDGEAIARTTPHWFLVDDDETECLFLKPDDADDVNNISRLRPDVADRLNQDA